ncbi:MAG: DUF4932 domain-containing protein, partial [Planctomycetes bacterium]|nr:DUF4932 domain-containing protein [Planctomycetota bacterium]
RRTRGVSFDACMSMAVHVDDAYALKARLPLDPWPDSLDSRWGVEGASRFLENARRFVEDTSFRQFIDAHRPLYQLAESRMQRVLDEQAHLEWFDVFFGRRPQAIFKFTLGMLNGGACYGPRYRRHDGKEELYCILGVWKTDSEGMPVFDRQMLETVVHEFCHSYTNAIVDRNEPRLEAAGKKIFPFVQADMRRQGYGNWKTMMYESMVRACVIRYTRMHAGPDAARRAITKEKARKFAWIEELSELLGEYETHRAEYADLDEYFPRVVDFFNDYADRFVEEQNQLLPRVTSAISEYGQKLVDQIELAAARPKVVSITPANGADDVDPNIRSIRVVFDRPMADGSWSMVGGGTDFPEIVGKPSYDRTRTIWTVSVRLKPAWSYRFMLNSDRFRAFQSQDGVPLEPVVVTFKTSDGKAKDAADSSHRP